MTVNWGTGAPSRPRAAGSDVKLPLVVAHPTVQVRGLPNAKVRHLRGVRLISATQVAFMTWGSSGCPWWPTRLTVLSPRTIRIDMRIRTGGGACPADLVVFPVAVKIDPRIVDIHRPLTVRLAYQANYCCGEGSKRWHRTFVAAAVPRTA